MIILPARITLPSRIVFPSRIAIPYSEAHETHCAGRPAGNNWFPGCFGRAGEPATAAVASGPFRSQRRDDPDARRRAAATPRSSRRADQTGPLPIIFKRTPYGIDGVGRQLQRATTRRSPRTATSSSSRTSAGSSSPKATFVMQRPPRAPGDTKSLDEGTDTYDTIEWLLKNVRNNNGRVGMLGVSYDGWTTIMGALEPHPALKAISPQASPADMWLGDDFHHNGAFRLSYGFEYAAMMESGKDVQQFAFDRYDTFDWYLQPRPARQRQREVPARQDPDLERLRRASRLRRVLEAADDDAAPHEREGADAERRRLVGPGGFLRPGRASTTRSRSTTRRASTTSSSARGTTAAGAAAPATRSARFRSAATPPSTSARRCRRRSSRTT